MQSETNLVQQIRLGCSDIAILYRNNTGKLQDRNGRWVTFGLFVGSGDLIGVRIADGRFISVEAKLPGKYPTKEQLNFIAVIQRCGGLAGVARSVDEARKIILGQ